MGTPATSQSHSHIVVRTESLSFPPQHHTQHQDAEHTADEESQREECKECNQERPGEGNLQV